MPHFCKDGAFTIIFKSEGLFDFFFFAAYAKIPDGSIKFVQELVGNEPRSLDNLADLTRELSAPLHGTILVPRDSLNLAAANIIPIKEWTDEDESTDMLGGMIQQLVGSRFSSGSKMEVTIKAFALTAGIWRQLDSLAPSLFLQCGLNIAETSGLTVAGKRPDLCVWVKGALLLKAEFKRSLEDMEKAKEELVVKMSTWNPIAFRGLPFLPCCVASGNFLQFCAITPPSGRRNMILCEASDIYNMETTTGCLSIVRASLNMMRVFKCLRERLPRMVPKLFYRQSRGQDGSSIEIRDDCVIKLCHPAPDAVYNCLRFEDPSSLPFAVTVVIGRSKPSGITRLEIRPVCVEQLPSTVEELRISLRCVLSALCAFHERGFVHRDVRWPNVLKDKETWLLADFELADFTGLPVPVEAIASAFLPPEVLANKEAGYSAAGDVYCVGKLMETWEHETKIDLPPIPKAFKSNLMNENPDLRPTASQLLARSWVSS